MISIFKLMPFFAMSAIFAVSASGNHFLANTGTTGVGCIGTVTMRPGCLVVTSGTISTSSSPFQLISAPAGSALETVAVTQPGTGVPVGWLSNNTTSRWITPNNLNAGMTDPAGSYIYTQTFTLDSAARVREIWGQWAADNSGMLELNGNVVSTIGSNDFGTWTPFTINSGFQTGVNTLTFTVMNNLSGPNQTPSGLRVEYGNVYLCGGGCYHHSLPEGSSTLELALLLGGVIMFRFTRRKVSFPAQ